MSVDNKLPLLDQNVLYLVVFGLWVLSAVVSTSYTFSWDILMDWSLFPNIPQRCCRKKALMLREDRIYAYKVHSRSSGVFMHMYLCSPHHVCSV